MKGSLNGSQHPALLSPRFSLLLKLKLKIALVRAKQPKYHREMGPNTSFKSKCEIVNKFRLHYQLPECGGILD